jgi:RNase P/RNase MRP subunit POP5
MPLKRESFRYLLIKIISKKDNFELKKESFHLTLINSILTLFGEVGLAESKLKLLIFNQEDKFAIVKCSRSFLNNFRAAIALINEIDNEPVLLFIAKASGTIKSIKKVLPASSFKKEKNNKQQKNK